MATNVRTMIRTKEESSRDYKELRELVNEVTKLSHKDTKNLFACCLEVTLDFQV